MSEQSLRWRGGWAHLDVWRGTPDVAYLAVGSREPPPRAVVDRCLAALSRHGFASVVTNALSTLDAPAFLDAGFAVRERLHVLVHDLNPPPRSRFASPVPSDPRPLRRARRSDRDAVLGLDTRAFDGFWRLDRDGLRQALEATPSARFRVNADGRPPVAYCITGRAGRGRDGYLQRIAVDPSAQSSGWGRVMVCDALGWLRRRGAGRAVVNTQLGNEPALALYRSCGFRELPVGLCVLGRSL